MFLSIDMSGEQIRVLECESSAKKLIIKSFASFACPESGISGGIIHQGIMVKALTDFLAADKITSKRAIVTVTSPAVIVKEVTVPKVKPRELRGMLMNSVRSFVNGKQDYVMDYVVLETVLQEGVYFYRVLTVLLPKGMVEMYRSFLTAAGLKPQSMDVLTHAIFKLIRADERYKDCPAVILAGLNEKVLDLHLMDGKDKILYRNIPVEEKSAVMESEFVLSFSRPGIAAGFEPSGRYAELASENISKMVQFQMMKNKECPVAQVLLFSEKAEEPMLAQKIYEDSRVEARVLLKPAFVEASEDFPFYKYAAAVGAAIGN